MPPVDLAGTNRHTSELAAQNVYCAHYDSSTSICYTGFVCAKRLNYHSIRYSVAGQLGGRILAKNRPIIFSFLLPACSVSQTIQLLNKHSFLCRFRPPIGIVTYNLVAAGTVMVDVVLFVLTLNVISRFRAVRKGNVTAIKWGVSKADDDSKAAEQITFGILLDIGITLATSVFTSADALMDHFLVQPLAGKRPSRVLLAVFMFVQYSGALLHLIQSLSTPLCLFASQRYLHYFKTLNVGFLKGKEGIVNVGLLLGILGAAFVAVWLFCLWLVL